MRPSAGRLGRIAGIDAMRGLAVVGMVTYHVAWDLQALGLTTAGPSDVAALRWLGNSVAAAFLLISGVGLHLAERAGHRWPRKLGRLGVLTLAAGAVTLVTGWVSPEQTVRFGILHCLALCNAIGLLIQRAGTAWLVGAGLGCVMLPLVPGWSLDPRWAWIGLSQQLPATLDFRPVLPWLAFVLLGIAVGRTGLIVRLAAIPLGTVAGRCAAFLGRHSLLIYLIHQPALLAALAPLAVVAEADRSAVPPIASTEAAAFLDACTRRCSAQLDATLCRSTCHCVLTASARPETGVRGLLSRIEGPEARLRHAAEVCRSDLPALPAPDTPRG